MSNAKAVLEWMSSLLGELGIRMDAETLRQAKFNTHAASGPIWRALHDMVLFKLWGQSDSLSLSLSTHDDKLKAHSAHRSIQELWREIEAEEGVAAGASFMPRDGALMTFRYLRAWGCPARLITTLQSHISHEMKGPVQKDDQDRLPCIASQTPSRPLLLVLSWLISDMRIIENFLRSLSYELSPIECLNLPPFPEDSCNTISVQRSYSEALFEANEYVSKVMKSIGRFQEADENSSSRLVNGDQEEDQWLAVQASSHQAVMMLGKVRALLSSHQSLCEARLRLQLGVRQAQTINSSSSSSLSPFEVHLLSSQKAMDEHLAALGKVSDIITRQAEAARCARLWFSWLSSVVSEDLKASQMDGSVSKGTVKFEGWEALASLPQAGSSKATAILVAMDHKLQEAVIAAAPSLAAARSTEKKKKKLMQSPSAVQEISMDQFILLAEQSLVSSQLKAQEMERGEDSKSQDLLLLKVENQKRGEDLVKITSCISHFDIEVKPLGGSAAKAKPSKAAIDGGDGWVGGSYGGPTMEPEEETLRLTSLSLQVSKALARTRAEGKAAITKALDQLARGGVDIFKRL